MKQERVQDWMTPDVISIGVGACLPDAHELMARIAMMRGDLETAETEARTAMSLEDRRAGPRLVLTDILFAGGRPMEAIEVLETTFNDGKFTYLHAFQRKDLVL